MKRNEEMKKGAKKERKKKKRMRKDKRKRRKRGVGGGSRRRRVVRDPGRPETSADEWNAADGTEMRTEMRVSTWSQLHSVVANQREGGGITYESNAVIDCLYWS